MAAPQERYDFDRVFRLLLTLLTIGGTLWLLVILSDVLVPFAVAVLLAYLLNPIVNAFETRTEHRGFAVALTLAVFSVFLLVSVPLVGWFVVNETLDIVKVLSSSDLRDRIDESITPIQDWLQGKEVREEFSRFIEQIKAEIDPQKLAELGPKLFKMATQSVGTGLALLVNLLGGVFSAILACSVFLVVFMYLVFLLLDFNSFQKHWKDHLPPDYRDSIVLFIDEFSNAMSRYFRGQFLVAMSCGIIFAIGFKIVGIRMAVVLGLFIGLLNMVPYLQMLGLIPAVLLAVLKAFETDGSVWGPLVGVLVVFGLVQLIQDGLLVPKIMGQSTGLKPWVILLCVFVWGKLLGFLGLVLAIPLSCLGLAYYRRNVLGRVEPTPSTPDGRSAESP